MDQGVLVAIKCRYRKKILEELVLQKGNGTSIVAFLRGINMLKVSEMIAASWNEIGKKRFATRGGKSYLNQQKITLSKVMRARQIMVMVLLQLISSCTFKYLVKI